jgi:hypothetical protein
MFISPIEAFNNMSVQMIGYCEELADADYELDTAAIMQRFDGIRQADGLRYALYYLWMVTNLQSIDEFERKENEKEDCNACDLQALGNKHVTIHIPGCSAGQ